MKIEIDTNNLSELDRQILSILAGEAVAPTPVAEPVKTPAKKAAPAKAAPALEPTPEPDVPTSEEATAGGDEDLLGGEEAPTMSDAVAAATKLVSSGGAAKVKAALAEAGAKRVSELAVDQIPTFLAALA